VKARDTVIAETPAARATSSKRGAPVDGRMDGRRVLSKVAMRGPLILALVYANMFALSNKRKIWPGALSGPVGREVSMESSVGGGGSRIFLGYPRADGTVGIRNYLLVLSVVGLTGPTARRIARNVAGAVVVTTPYGRCQVGEDAALHTRTLVGLGASPNVGAVLVIGADRATVDSIGDAIAVTGKPVERLSLQDVQEDAFELSVRGIRIAGQLAREISGYRREAVSAAKLFVAVECGLSDATSGLAANPLVGRASDWVVEQGGRVVIGETLEWLGAEEELRARAATPELGERIVAAVRRREVEVAALGIDLTGNNPGPENIRGGLTTIEEKSLGAIAKSGHRPFVDLVPMAAPCRRPGLHGMDALSFAPESMTGFVSAGANLVLFTTGAGNSLCSLLAPTIKISGNPKTSHRLREQIDFDAGGVVEGWSDLGDESEKLVELMLAVASGSLTLGEVFIEGDESFGRVGGSI
jgi:altronate dehydratase large subunit